MATVHLDSDFRSLLVNLAIPPQAGAWSPTPEHDQLLVRELERLLADPPYLAAYLEAVRPLPRPAPDFDILDPTQVESVLARGLADLPSEVRCRLALQVPTLLALRDRVIEELPTSNYWWQRTRDYATARGALRSVREVLAAAGVEALPPCPAEGPTRVKDEGIGPRRGSTE
jgi:hypothetical protein